MDSNMSGFDMNYNYSSDELYFGGSMNNNWNRGNSNRGANTDTLYRDASRSEGFYHHHQQQQQQQQHLYGANSNNNLGSNFYIYSQNASLFGSKFDKKSKKSSADGNNIFSDDNNFPYSYFS